MTPEERAIRERHRHDEDRVCLHDGQPWPCDATQALDLLTAANAEVERLEADATSVARAHWGLPAVVAERARIAKVVEGLRRPGRSDVNFRAVLAAIEEAEGAET